MRKLSTLLVILIATLVMGQTQQVRKDVFIGTPTNIAGGHSPFGYSSDYFDTEQLPGVYNLMQNMSPLDAQPGALTTRRSVRWVEDFEEITEGGDDFTDTVVVVWEYLPQARTAANLKRGAFVYARKLTTGLDSVYAYREYFETSAAEMDTFYLQETQSPTVWTTATGLLEPGDGEWRRSNAYSRVYMAGGIVVPDSAEGHFDEGGPAATYFQWFDWGPDSTDGMFWTPIDSGQTAGPMAGVDNSQYAVVPEKPYTQLGGASYNVTFNSVADAVDPGLYEITGDAYWGYYSYKVCPVDLDGEVGPPILTTSTYVPKDGDVRRYRGVSVVHRIAGADPDSLRPSITSLRIYGTYKNPYPFPDDEYWDFLVPAYTEAIPVDKTNKLVAEIDFNGRQFDLPNGAAVPDSAEASTHPHSSRFNYFVGQGDEEGWIKGRLINAVGGDPDTIKAVHNVVNEYLYTADGAVDDIGLEDAFIEVKGYGGVWKIDSFVRDGGRNYYILADNIGLSEDTTDVRFCYPWQPSSTTDKYTIQFYDRGPEYWFDEDMPFPSEATASFNADYPYYMFHAENPSGTRRLAWFYQKSANWDGLAWHTEVVDNVLLYTTNNVNGHNDTKRFAAGIPIGGRITGAAFIDDDRFVVSTEAYSYYGQYQQVDNQWVANISKRLEYGNKAFNLTADNETVYGLDHRYGLWGVGYNLARIRTDIEPVGEQTLLMNSMQQDWFYDRLGSKQHRLDATKITVTPEMVLLNFPRIDTTSYGSVPMEGGEDPGGGWYGGGFNWYWAPPGGGGGSDDTDPHCWLSLYRSGAGMLSYDFSRETGSANYVPVMQPIIGPHGQIFFHRYSTGFWTFNRSRTNRPLDLMAPDAGGYQESEANINWAIETGWSYPNYPEQQGILRQVFVRAGPRGELIKQLLIADATDASGDEVTLWTAPRGDTLQYLIHQGDTLAPTAENYTLDGARIAFAGVDIALEDSVQAEYYAPMEYTAAIDFINFANTDTTISYSTNYREGRLLTPISVPAEHWRMRLYGYSVEPVVLRGIHAWLQPAQQSGQLTTESVDGYTGFYGVNKTEGPVLGQ